MGRHRTDPPEQRKRTLMRQATAQIVAHSIGGRKKEGGYAPRKPSLPKMPWDDKLEEKLDEH